MRTTRVEKENNWADSKTSPEERDIIEVALWLMQMQPASVRVPDDTPTARIAFQT